jgi:signal transduction histidine kinase
MKSPHARHSKKPSRSKTMKVPGGSPARRNRPVAGGGVSANELAGRKRAMVAREKSVGRREAALERQEAALRARETSVQAGAAIGRLMSQMREANERLIVAAVHAQDLSDEAQEETAQAKRELDSLMNQLREANERLTAAAVDAHMMAADARQSEEEYRQLSNRLLTLQDEERRRLARDLHDSTAQCLVALIMNLDIVASAKNALDAQSRQALTESRSLAEECCREVRTLSYLLHPPLLDIAGLVSAVRWYVEGFSKRSGIHVVMDLAEIARLPRPIETALFRVVQESLTNVHRHASTTTASIRLSTTTAGVALEIQDQGRGLRDRLLQESGTPQSLTLGVGIQGMRERIRQLGGTFDIEFTGSGTTVHVSVPSNGDTL